MMAENATCTVEAKGPDHRPALENQMVTITVDHAMAAVPTPP